MNAEEIRSWVFQAYNNGEFTDGELEIFIGECLAMNIDPRMRPRIVTPRRSPSGVVYAHRHTNFMEFTAESILRDQNKNGVFGREAMYRPEMGGDANLKKLSDFGLTNPGDLLCEIPYTINEARAYYDEVDRRFNNEMAHLGQITFAERLELRKEIKEILGEPPSPRVVTGIGTLPAATPHDVGVGRSRLTREQRVVILAKRDALDQVFPAMFSVK